MATGFNAKTVLDMDEDYKDILKCDAGFTFWDFVPEMYRCGGFEKEYENFSSVVQNANELLRDNKNWKVITCENVNVKSRKHKLDEMRMTYKEHGNRATSYLRGLRLWLTERKDEKETAQQIGYFDIVPQQLEKQGRFNVETLDTVIERFNTMQRSNPIPGRIIGIQTQKMKYTDFEDFDPEVSDWSEDGLNGRNTFVFVLRIFYEIMTGCSQEIGVKNFIPEHGSERNKFSLSHYECFSDVLNKASAWCAQQQNLSFCNAQTLQIKLRSEEEINTQKMNYTVSGSTHYARVLRIAYTKPLANSVSAKPFPISELTCKTFRPVSLTTSKCERYRRYKDLDVTRESISAWVKTTGARVLSAETVPYRTESGGERKQGTEASYTYDEYSKFGGNIHWMFVIRLYLEGAYSDPPPEM